LLFLLDNRRILEPVPFLLLLTDPDPDPGGPETRGSGYATLPGELFQCL
jgi:hypothetical protein